VTAPGSAVSRGPDRLADAAGQGVHAAGGLDDRAYGLLQALLALGAEDVAASAQHQRLEAELAVLRALQEQLLDDLAGREVGRRAIGELLQALEQATAARAARRQALCDALYTPAAVSKS
jgi:hypothetical protein